MDNLHSVTHTDNVRLSDDGESVIIIDQTKLPGKIEYLSLGTESQLYDAILSLKVRGAPAIGICAGYGMYVLACKINAAGFDDFFAEFHRLKEYIFKSRPTAVNLGWALERMERVVTENKDLSIPEILKLLKKECCLIHEEDMIMCRAISENGLSLLKDGDGVLTHCNAGPLATSRYGTGIGPVMLGLEKGMNFHVFADETRPLLQGARLTAFELERAGADVTLICDNMAGVVMKNGWVSACMVGCDRIASNGDTANKIGTSSVAILAHYYNIPFYVLGPTSSIDMNTPCGNEIPIELRDPEEIRSKWYKEPMAPCTVKCYNPAFDVTDHSLITAIITEKGICRPPYSKSLAGLFNN